MYHSVKSREKSNLDQTQTQRSFLESAHHERRKVGVDAKEGQRRKDKAKKEAKIELSKMREDPELRC